MAENVMELTDSNFEAEVIKSDKPVLVDFWAEWCQPCRKIEVMLNEIAGGELADKVKIVKLDIDANPETAVAYQVMSVPTLTVFKNGQPFRSVMGARPKGDLVRLIESALETAA
jgi:thioredoxin 1